MDKRAAVRVPVRVKARCRSEGVVIHGLVEDLSRSGMFLRAPNHLAAGATAEITLEGPGDDGPVQLAARVVRVEQAPAREGMAFRFVDARAASRPLANLIMRQHQSGR